MLDTDAGRARAKAREFAQLYLGLSNYANNLMRLGLHRRDIANGGSDRLIETVVPHGSAQELARSRPRASEAGADHVAVQVIGEAGIPRRGWTAMAHALLV